ncbi:MAG: sigma-70 family RNA polymerase sigma factor [Polyangiaceae bacterium]|nr:sigma-70 family RNA polymerase sigma factor [Polyangiaceae bacterium]
MADVPRPTGDVISEREEDVVAHASLFLEEITKSLSFEERSAIASLMERACREATATWQGVIFPPIHVVARRALDRLGDTADPVSALERKHLVDLFLACACASGEPRAMRHVEERFLTQIGSFVRKIDSSQGFADEVRAAVRVKLFVGGDDLHPKIAEYTGAGPLEGWLRVVAVRTAQNLVRARKPGGDQAHDLPLAAAAHDPELALARTQYSEAFRTCFAEAVAALSSEERTLLKFHYVDGLTSEQSAKMYGASPATVRRRLATARQALLVDTRKRLSERLRVPLVDLDAILGELQSGLDLSLSRILRGSVQAS